MQLIEVAFKGNRKEFYAWEGDEPPPLRSAVVVEADRGEDLGVVHAVGDVARTRCAGCAHGTGPASPSRKALRVAASRDVRQAAELRAQDETARRKATERVKAHGLVMKLTDAEWQWDRKKLTFYFTAEKRVDFRNLVRDLAALFRARIELKQIGVRDEAKRLDGIGRCGRQYCSASWLPELRPVNLGVAKDQQLSLNPSQISGACGRLMCCLRYEHEFYVESRKRFPKEGKLLVTPRGEEKVVANDIFNERVTLRAADGELRVVQLAVLRRELAATGHPVPGESGHGGVGVGGVEAAESPDDGRTEHMGLDAGDDAPASNREGDDLRALADEGAIESDVRAGRWPDTAVGAPDERFVDPRSARTAGDARKPTGPRADRRPAARHSAARPPRRPAEADADVEEDAAPEGQRSGDADRDDATPRSAAAVTGAPGAASGPASGGGRRRRGRRGGRRGRGRGPGSPEREDGRPGEGGTDGGETGPPDGAAHPDPRPD